MTVLFVAVLLLCCQDNAMGNQGHKDHECHGQGVKSCGECLASGPYCAWCTEESFIEAGQNTWERCDTASALLKRGCLAEHIEDARGSTVFLANHQVTSRTQDQRHQPHDITQLQPQRVLLHLRPGEPQTFEVKFKQVEDYPIDLYYLMDLSFSMEDDLPNVKRLGADLMEEMRNITNDFRMGFGAFVDKTVMPYISTTEEMLQNPCKRTQPWPCSPPFTYHHILGLTANGSLFTELVGGQRISGNLDSPEGGLDALMQAAMCEEHIGWRNVTRLLVFSTDAGFHFAGDGKLGGIVLPNDGKCHLENNVYTRGDFQDYPSVAHLAEKLRKKNIQIIFAVTEDVTHLYEGLRSVFPKCAVGTLSNNSHNILQIIVEAYNALTSEVIMDNSELPAGFHIAYSSHCKDYVLRTGDQGRRCSNILVGDEVRFNVTITAPPCVAGMGKSRLVIKPHGYSEEVEVLLKPICDCPCQREKVTQSPSCSNGNGTLECGACRCKEGRVGTFCECVELSKGDGRHLCRRDNTLEECSGHGECVCGKCVCQKIHKNPTHAFYGQYCECNDLHCDQYQGSPCGGRGRCVCGVCQCFPGFSGSACECPLSMESCLSHSGLVCAGRGFCSCGACICQDSRFQGPTCELCPSCPNACTLYRDCVLCRAFSQGLSEGECERRCSNMNLTLVDELGQLPLEHHSTRFHRCKERDTDGCWVHFLHRAGQREGFAHINAALKQECPSGPDMVLITMVVSGTIVVLGVASLLLWKLVTTIHDRREFARFQKDLEKMRWDRGDNPIYKSAITTVINPKYKAQ